MTAPGDALPRSGLAKNSNGGLADMPRSIASEISGEAFDALTLLHAARLEIESRGDEDDNLTSHQSRADSLLILANKSIRQVLAKLEPYV